MLSDGITVTEFKQLVSIFPSQHVLTYVVDLQDGLIDPSPKRRAAFSLMVSRYRNCFDGHTDLTKHGELEQLISEFLSSS